MSTHLQHCLVKNCNSTIVRALESGVTYHKFPVNPDEKEEWIKFIKSSNESTVKKWKLTANSKMRSRHFQLCCFENYGLLRKVKDGHRPSIKIDLKGNASLYNANHIHIIRQESTLDTDATDHLMEIKNLTSEDKFSKIFAENEKLKKSINESDLLNSAYLTQIWNYQDRLNSKNKLIKKLTRKHSKGHSPSSLTGTSTKDRGIQTENWTPGSNQPSDNCVKLIESILVRRAVPRNKEYDILLKEFSVQLHYYSFAAYEFLRNTFMNKLPHTRSLRVWMSGINCATGFLESSLNFLKARNDSSFQRIYYALSLDEVYIRKQIIFDGQRMRGYVDYGNFGDANSEVEATRAQFVMVTEINGRLRIPIGYVLTNGCDGQLIALFIQKSLEKLNNNNCKVLTITFDGPSTNFAGGELLGANFKVTSPKSETLNPEFKTFITHPTPTIDDKIYFVPDAVHMVKLIRNMLKSCGTLIDSEGWEIKWIYFENLLKLQKREGLRAGNRLTTRHVKFEKDKMKVKLAVQLLSSSVAAAFSFCQKIGLSEFQGCEGTINFVKIIDRVFDSLNSHPGGDGFKAPLANWNRNLWKKLLTETTSYLLGLKIKSTGQFVIHSSLCTGIKRLIVGMKSLMEIMDTIVLPDETLLKYLSTYKLSQNSLELFFSALRQRFGRNNNPNVLQLEAALRHMLAVKILPSMNSNSTAQEETSFAKVSPFCKVVSKKRDKQEEANIQPELLDFSFQSLSSYVSNVVVYIAGFVGRSVQKKLSCPTCILSLINSDSTSILVRSDFMLINEKNNGGLFVPSPELIDACKLTEQVIREIHAREGARILTSGSILKLALRRLTTAQTFTQLRIINEGDHNPLTDHVLQLLKLIVNKYITIRLHHIAKKETLQKTPISIREHLNRTSDPKTEVKIKT